MTPPVIRALARVSATYSILPWLGPFGPSHPKRASGEYPIGHSSLKKPVADA